jgi:hypothetical protein
MCARLCSEARYNEENFVESLNETEDFLFDLPHYQDSTILTVISTGIALN